PRVGTGARRQADARARPANVAAGCSGRLDWPQPGVDRGSARRRCLLALLLAAVRRARTLAGEARLEPPLADLPLRPARADGRRLLGDRDLPVRDSRRV